LTGKSPVRGNNQESFTLKTRLQRGIKAEASSHGAH